MQASGIMSKPVITVSKDTTIGEAADLMTQNRISCLPVVDASQRVVGILTHTDFVLHPRFLGGGGQAGSLLGTLASPAEVEQVAQQVRSKSVKEVMSREVVTVQVDTPLAEVVQLMLRHRVSRLPVVLEGKLVGIITRHDLLKLYL